MKAVVLGMSEPPLLPKYRQAATITTSNARMAIRSVCLGSCPLGLIFQRIVFDLRNKVPNQYVVGAAVPGTAAMRVSLESGAAELLGDERS